ncbi:lysophospholipid acyltransferase family protein [bacterium]|nr:lysophospholipid acyltransferase family protein [bacterium]
MPGAWKKVSHLLEYVAARVAIAALRAAPQRTALAFGGRLGEFAWDRIGMRRGEVRRELALSFPDLGAPELESLGRRCYVNLGRVFVEMFLAPTLSTERMAALIEMDGRAVLEEALAEGRGVVNVTFHYGDWELMGAYTARLGYPLDVIARGQKNPWFHRYVTRMRTASGMRLIPVTQAPRAVPRALRQGRIVSFLADQDAHGEGEFVPFLGRPASTPKGPALYAFRYGCPVVFTLMLPLPDGRWRVHFERAPRPETVDREQFVRELTAWYTRRLEDFVRQRPEHWFWPHRRWKTRPPGD